MREELRALRCELQLSVSNMRKKRENVLNPTVIVDNLIKKLRNGGEKRKRQIV